MAKLPIVGLRTHASKVCSLYKAALRDLEDWIPHRDVMRYEAVLLRARFDANKDITDMAKANRLLVEGQEELFQGQHYQPKKFPHSPGGVAWKREVTPPDWVLDYWHPLEKAMYPEYFARREERKKEYIIWWEKQYGKPKPEDHQHH